MKIKFLIPILFFLFSCSETEPIEAAKEATPEDLINHTEEFRKEIIEVTEGIHVAVGFALANAIKPVNALAGTSDRSLPPE